MKITDGINIEGVLQTDQLSSITSDDVKKKIDKSLMCDIASVVSETKMFYDPEARDSLRTGTSVATNGNIILAGSNYYTVGEATGCGGVFVLDAQCNLLYILTAPDLEEDDHFGCSVAISDNRIVVGAFGDDDDDSNSGAVYVFDISGEFIVKLKANVALSGPYLARFHGTIAVSNNRILVGDSSYDSSDGAAYLYDINGNLIKTIQPNNIAADDGFGYRVALSDNRMVVSSPYSDIGATSAGSAYIFDIDGNELAMIQALNLNTDDRFGYGVAVSNNRVVVGAYEEDTTQTEGGVAYIYDIAGNFISRVVSSDPGAYGHFGEVMCANDTHIVISARQDDVSGVNMAGAAYIFDINGNEIAKIQASDPGANVYFGNASAISRDSTIVVGAAEADTANTNSGTVYMYKTIPNDETTSTVAGAQSSGYTYANLIDKVYEL